MTCFQRVLRLVVFIFKCLLTVRFVVNKLDFIPIGLLDTINFTHTALVARSIESMHLIEPFLQSHFVFNSALPAIPFIRFPTSYLVTCSLFAHYQLLFINSRPLVIDY